MDVRFVDDEFLWDVPLGRAENAQLLQSWWWGVFQQTLGRRVWRLQVREGDAVVAATQLVAQPLPFGQRYLYAPRGPVLLSSDVDAYETAVHHLSRATRELARRERATFTRWEPVAHGASESVATLVASYRFRPAPSVQPRDELAVRATADEAATLAGMHEKTRYNVRLAQKRGVRPRLIEQPEYARRVFPFFWRLLGETARRQRIRTHPRSYYEQLLTVLMPRGAAKLLIAEHDNDIVAAHLLTVFGDTVYYLHGGSAHAHRALMAPHLLHWEGVRLTKRLGKTYYNLGGVSPAGGSGHAWASLSRFKEGFARVGETGASFSYPGAFDLVFHPLWYTMYTAARWTQRQLHRR